MVGVVGGPRRSEGESSDLVVNSSMSGPETLCNAAGLPRGRAHEKRGADRGTAPGDDFSRSTRKRTRAYFAEHMRSYFRRFSEIRTEHMRGWGSRECGFAPRDRR